MGRLVRLWLDWLPEVRRSSLSRGSVAVVSAQAGGWGRDWRRNTVRGRAGEGSPWLSLMLSRSFAFPVLPLSLMPSDLASINRSYPHPGCPVNVSIVGR